MLPGCPSVAGRVTVFRRVCGGVLPPKKDNGKVIVNMQHGLERRYLRGTKSHFRWLPSALVILLMCGLSATSHAQDDKTGASAGTNQSAGPNETEGGDSKAKAESAETADDGQEADDEKTIETPEDAEKVVKEATEDVKQTAGEAVEAIKSGDLETAAEKSGELFKKYGIPAITALVMLIVAYFIAAFLSRLVSRPVQRRVDETLGRFVGKVIFYLIMIGAILGVLQYFGVGITSFAAIIAAAGFAVGLAFQGTLSNFAAGIMLLVFRPFKVGDVINAAGITAKVYEIDLFHTIFDTFDNRRIVVPNSQISSGTIENIAHHGERRVDVAVGVAYNADLQRTRDTLTAAAETQKKFLVEGEGRGYQVALLDLGDSAVNWVVRFWTKADDFWSVKEQLTAAVKEHLDAAGIGIPYPQLDVHLHQQQG